jgi:hypothetical protein
LSYKKEIPTETKLKGNFKMAIETISNIFMRIGASVYASINFSLNENLVPENYGLTELPLSANVASFSVSEIMGVTDAAAEERLLNTLY